MQKWLSRGLVSPSDMNAFLPESGCPLRWKYRKEDRPGIAVDRLGLLLGSNIHLMIKNYFQRISDKPSPAEVKSVAASVYQEGLNRRDLDSVHRSDRHGGGLDSRAGAISADELATRPRLGRRPRAWRMVHRAAVADA